VLDLDDVSVAVLLARERDDAVAHGTHGRADGRAVVDALVAAPLCRIGWKRIEKPEVMREKASGLARKALRLLRPSMSK
jgi:hypothetical protein